MNEPAVAHESFCALCGNPGPFAPFFSGASLRETRCPGCRSSRRTRELVQAILKAYTGDITRSLSEQAHLLRYLAVYELQASGPLHNILKTLPCYVCSEYYPHTALGTLNHEGVLCQDVQALTFCDKRFDIVISQDVMEHVPDPWIAFKEIRRVLKPGGRHFFTVPVHEGYSTRQRTRKLPSGELEYLWPPVHHKDPLNPEGALVFWDYGDDLGHLLERQGVVVKTISTVALYPPENVCCVGTQEQYNAYQAARAEDRVAAFFLYNPVVFVTS